MSSILNFIRKYNILILIIIGILLYFPTLFYDFVYDDSVLLLQNSYLNGKIAINFIDFFVPSFVRTDIYIPLTFIIWWSIIKIFGINSFAFHFVNVVFYILSSVTLYYLLQRIINDDLISFFSVVLYIIHPCHIENTAWISAMGYNMALLFLFLSFICFILAFDENKKVNYVYSVLFYILAILSQPIAVVLPAILFLWVYCFRKQRLKESIISIFSYLPFLFLYLFLYRQTILQTDRFIQFEYTILEKFSILGFDIFNSFIPLHLCPIQPIPSLFYVIPLVLFICALYFFRNNKTYFFFLVLIIISLFPYSNIFFSMEVAIADRYLLLTSVSSCILIFYLCFYFFNKFRNKIVIKYSLFIFFLVLYLGNFMVYLPIWENNKILSFYAYNMNPNNIVCANVYGTYLLGDEKYDEVLDIANNIIKNNPDYFEGYELKIKTLIFKGDINGAADFCNRLENKFLNNYKIYFYLFDIYINFQDYDKAELYLNLGENKYRENNLYKNEIMDLFLQKKMILYFVKAEPNEFIKSLKIFSNNFKLLQDDDFAKKIEKTNYKIREEICLNYLKKDNGYSIFIIRLLSCLYMREIYKENASEIMKSLLANMDSSQEFIKNGDNGSAEKIYLSVIDKNKYMYQAYYNLGILYLQTNRREKAKEIFNQMLDINPNDEQIKQLLNDLRI